MTKWQNRAFARSKACGVKRAVVFQNPKYLTFDEAAEELPNHISSQVCPRCGQCHDGSDYELTDLQCAEQVIIH